MKYTALFIVLSTSAGIACASPTTYNVDPNHTHPMFEADHLGGLSIWRGLFRRVNGAITVDPAANTGTVDVSIDMASVDFGNDELNNVAVNSAAPPIFEVKKYPTAMYKGTLGNFVNGSPTTAFGLLTLHGVTKPLVLIINSFKCIDDKPEPKQQLCGADAFCMFDRADFGITVGQRYGFKMDVTLRIQVEAIRKE
jgi:polyisoprenoid-binding protein YceI